MSIAHWAKSWIKLGLACSMIFASANYSFGSIVTIDPFTASQTLNNPGPSGTVVSNGTAAPGALGGARVFQSYYVTSDGGGNATLVSGTPSGTAAFNQDVSVTANGLIMYTGSTTPLASWDGTIAGTTPNAFGLGGVDLTGGGVNTQIRVRAASDQSVDVTMTFYDNSAGNFARRTFTIPGTSPQTFSYYTLPFNVFTLNGSFNSGSWSSVDAITVFIAGANGSDTSFRYFAADDVPEPATFGLMALGLAGTVAFARRKFRA